MVNTRKITDAEYQESRIAAKLLAFRKLQSGDPFPIIRYEWPELIITDKDELAVFAKFCERKDNLNLRLDDFQVDSLNAVFDGNHTQLYLSGGTKLGKGFLIGGLVTNLWWNLYQDCKIVLVGPATEHLKLNLFGEACTWRRRMASFKDGSIPCDVQKEVIEEPGRSSHAMKLANTSAGESLSGNHSSATMFIFDEASSSPDDFYNNALSQARFLIGISNPRAPSGWFYRAFASEKGFSSGSKTVQATTGPRRLISVGAISCLNVKAGRLSMNVAPPKGINLEGRDLKPGEPIPVELRKNIQPLIPGQICLDHCQALMETCSKDEVEWRVYGRFPDSSSDFMVFQPSWQQASTDRWNKIHEKIECRAVGIDVASSIDGDYTAIAIGDTQGMKEIILERNPNLTDLRGFIYASCRMRGMELQDGFIPVAIDAIAIGKNLASEMADEGCNVIAVENNKVAERDKELYGNRRAEVYGELACLLDPRLTDEPWAMDDDPALWEELFALERIYMANGRAFRITPKKRSPAQRQMKIQDNRSSVAEKIGRSPDRSDAISLLGQAIRELPEFSETGNWHQFNPDGVLTSYRNLDLFTIRAEFMDGAIKDYTKENFIREFGTDPKTVNVSMFPV